MVGFLACLDGRRNDAAMMRGNEQEPSLKEKRRCAMKMPPPAPSSEGAVIKYVCGIDIGSQCCVGCICRPDKSVVKKRDPLCQCQRGLADLGRETEAVGCSCWRDPHWHGSHLPLRGKSLSGVGAARVRAASLTSRTNPSFSSTARVTSQDGPTRCHDHCPSIVEWGGTNGLCAGRASGDLSRTGALAYATLGYSRQLSKRDPGPGCGALPRIHPGQSLSLLTYGSRGAQSLPQCSGPGRSRGRSPCPGVTSTASRPLWTSDCQETGGPGQSEREQWASKSRTLDQPAHSLRSTGAHPG